MQSRDNVSRVFAIIGLLIGIVALTIGFAAFNATLTIQSSAEVDVEDKALDIVFSTVSNAKTNGSVTPVMTGTGATGDNATIVDTTISGIHAKFTAPGQKATYTFNVYNASPYVAKLKSATFANASGQSANKVCTAADSSVTQSYVNNACNGISIKVTVGTTSPLIITGTEASLSRDLAATTGEQVVVEIEYAAGSSEADGDFDVAFGDITLNYSTV